MHFNKAKGFTLIELLVVIAIIGILAAIVLTALGGSRAKGRDSKRVSEIQQIKYGLELYFNINGAYPTCLYALAGCATSLQNSSSMPNPPKDPNGINYNYVAYGGGAFCTGYHLGTSIEVPKSYTPLVNDADKAVGATLCTGGATGVTDFSGLSSVVGGGACDTSVGVAQPAANATESCYDLVP